VSRPTFHINFIGNGRGRWLTRRVSQPKNNVAIAGSLLFVVFLWGGNNVGTKWLVAFWPPIWTGGIRLLFAGLLLLAVLRFTSWLGGYRPLTPGLRRQLWLRGGVSLAVYMVVFTWALRLTAASHVVLYLAASPVWTLLWEERPQRTWASARRYGAAVLALGGVLVLFWPALHTAKLDLIGEFCGLAAGILWANFNHQMRFLSASLSGAEAAAHTMWMSGIALLPLGLAEIVLSHGIAINAGCLGVLAFCILCGGVIPYALWNNALCHWPTSRVMLFNNLLPLSTMAWAGFLLHEPFTSTFGVAMLLIVAGVVLGQADWGKFFKLPEGF
jgi:drug/metabolite transporter (DMT)-like permease